MEAPVISAIITVSGALIGAFGGAYLANRFADSRYVKQIQAEKDRDEKKILIAKGEELYLALSKWKRQNYFFFLARVGFLNNQMTQDEHESLINSRVDPSVHDTVDSLTGFYFPAFTSDLKVITDRQDSANNTYKSIMDNLARISNEELVAKNLSIDEDGVFVSQKISDLRERLRAEIMGVK